MSVPAVVGVDVFMQPKVHAKVFMRPGRRASTVDLARAIRKLGHVPYEIK